VTPLTTTVEALEASGTGDVYRLGASTR